MTRVWINYSRHNMPPTFREGTRWQLSMIYPPLSDQVVSPRRGIFVVLGLDKVVAIELQCLYCLQVSVEKLGKKE